MLSLQYLVLGVHDGFGKPVMDTADGDAEGSTYLEAILPPEENVKQPHPCSLAVA